MIHTVETAGTVAPSSAGSVCTLKLGSLVVDIVSLGLIRIWIEGGRLETIEEFEFDLGKCSCYWLLKAIAKYQKRGITGFL